MRGDFLDDALQFQAEFPKPCINRPMQRKNINQPLSGPALGTALNPALTLNVVKGK